MPNQNILLQARNAVRALAWKLERAGHTREPGHKPVIVRNITVIHCNRYSHSAADRRKMWRSDEWWELRGRLLHERGEQCENCGGRERLAAHHRYYFPQREVWEYETEDLLVLCKACHSVMHRRDQDAVEVIYDELCLAPLYDLIRRQNEASDQELLNWEVDAALGHFRDPSLAYDEDNPGDWHEEHDADPGDAAEAKVFGGSQGSPLLHDWHDD